MKNFKIVFVTSKASESEKIAKSVVENKLAACANIVKNINSFYWWENKVQNDTEDLIIFKTKKSKLKKLIKKIKEIHSYTVPEIIAFDITKGNKNYLDWIKYVLK
jgi:periplasmic divalent cation tolerance protein